MPRPTNLPEKALAHIPPAALEHVQAAFETVHPTEQAAPETAAQTAPQGPVDFGLPDAALAHMSPQAFEHAPAFFGLDGATSDWSLAEAAMEHMSDTAQSHVPAWFEL